ncbi:MAG: citrate lyase holo-[Clostridia bacterium]|nr:citrate lyase holo-[acyl-carrier protein] synthase [Clostridia bacterium]
MEESVEITLEELLQSRDDRAAFQTILLNGYHTPLVSFTVNMPGKIKRDRRSKTVFDAGVLAIREALAGQIVYYKLLDKITGPEGYFAVDMEPLILKEKTAAIETGHPLGRLMDIDVLSAPGVQVSRAHLGQPPRKCLVCGQPAAACARSRAHPPEQLLAAIDGLLIEWEKTRDAR